MAFLCLYAPCYKLVTGADITGKGSKYKEIRKGKLENWLTKAEKEVQDVTPSVDIGNIHKAKRITVYFHNTKQTIALHIF